MTTHSFQGGAAPFPYPQERRCQSGVSPADLLLRGGIVVTMDGAGRVFAPGVVVVKGDVIIAVGEPELEYEYASQQTLDCSGQIVMPGFVNAHTHLPMSLLRGLVDDLRLDVWLNGYMMPVEREFLDAEFCHWGTLLACAEMIQGGVTCFADMYYFEPTVATAASQAGLRGVCGATIMKFPTPDAASYDESLAECERFLAQWKNHPLIVPAVAPHAPYTCTPDILKEASALARRFDAPLLTHLSETAQEVQNWEDQYSCSPVQWVADQGIFEAKVVAAHCVHVDDHDIRLLARQGCSVAHNPTSNLKLASGIAPIGRMLELGVTLGIGTDGCASNNDLDMFEETRLAGLLPKGISGDPTLVPAFAALNMATIQGARALHLDHLTGSLEVGKRADIIVVDTGGLHAVPQYQMSTNNIYAHLVYAGKASDVAHTIVNGRLLMRDRQLLTIDVGDITSKAQGYAQKIGIFVQARDKNLLDKLVALGEVEREESFEVQVKARVFDREMLEKRIRKMPDFEIIRHTIREQYDTYLLFDDPNAGWLRYREDNITVIEEEEKEKPLRLQGANAPRIAPEYRLTLIGATREGVYENSAILTRSRYDAPAGYSLRFYKEYFQPSRIKEVIKTRSRYRIIFRGLQFALNLDVLSKPADAGTFLEIKSRTWSARDALRKAELITEMLSLLGIPEGDLVRGEYVTL